MIGAAFDQPAKLTRQVGQAAALDELHGEVRDAVAGADGVHRDDSRMLEQPGDLCFELESFDGFGVDRGC
jgi:hypothetical protein